jgi:hypothetical protein
MTIESSVSSSSTKSDRTHRTPADTIAHLRNLQGMRIYRSTLCEIRSVRAYYYPHFTDEEFREVLRGLGEPIDV